MPIVPPAPTRWTSATRSFGSRLWSRSPASQAAQRLGAATVLPGLDDWQLANDAWQQVQLAHRWNLITSSWDSVAVLPRDAELRLTRAVSHHAGQ